jgi:membrane protease YdiL (CAAX protease family)
VSELEQLGMTALECLLLAVPTGLVCLVLWRLLSPSSRRLLPWPRPQPADWTGMDVWAAFGIWILSQVFFATLLENSGLFQRLYGAQAGADAYRERKGLLMQLAAGTFSVAAILGWFHSTRGVPPDGLGLTGRRAAQNVVVGYLGWLVLTPTALLLYWLLQLLVPVESHPVERLSRQPLLEVEWVALTLGTLVVAPVLEELLFRGVLLRWQLSRGPDGQLVVGAAALMVAVLNPLLRGSFDPRPLIFVLAMLSGFALLPYAVERFRKRRRGAGAGGTAREELPDGPARADAEPTPWQTRPDQGLARYIRLASDRRANTLLALYGNGLLFAALHSSVWPSPIPLVLLGCGLAWLAYRTQSLLTTIVTHVLFNSVAFLNLLLEPGAAR